MRDPRSHRRYVEARAAWLPTAEPRCCLCGKPVNLALPGTHPAGPTVEHTLPIREILRITTTWADAVALACDTSLWRTAHLVCQQRQGARVSNVTRHQARPRLRARGPSRVW